MQAMLLKKVAPIESSPLVPVELPTPEPRAREVLLRVEACAICRTDLHVIEGDLPTHKLPVIPGHQAIGRVEKLGEGCTRLAVGDRVGVAWLRWTCGACRWCRSGRENLCQSPRFTGYDADGGFAEYTVIDENFAYPIPPIFSAFEATPLLCAGIIGYRSLQRSRLPDGGSIALFGFGSSAHVVLQIAKHRRAEVYVVTRGQRHRELARQLGADWVGESAAQIPRKVDSAIVFAPAGELVPPALAALDKGGTLALAGIYMTPIPTLDYQATLFYERDLRSVTSNTRGDGQELLAVAAQIPLRPRIATYPLAEANRALQDLKQDKIAGTGVLIMPGFVSGE
jgi:propanol-preferring alcohol dehydrogenase